MNQVNVVPITIVMIVFFNRTVPAKAIYLLLRRSGVLVLLRLLLVPQVRSDAQRPRPDSRLHQTDCLRTLFSAAISLSLPLIIVSQLRTQ